MNSIQSFGDKREKNVLFYHLGNVNKYSKIIYTLDDEELNEENDKLYINYICKKWGISEIYLFTTTEIIGKKDIITEFFRHFSIEQDKIVKHLGCKVLKELENIQRIFEEKTRIKLFIKTKDREKIDEEELKDLAGIIKRLYDEKANILFDITHSYRDIPLYYLSLINLIKSAENIDSDLKLKFIYVRENEDDKAEIEILSNIKELQDWSYATYLMKKSFNLSPLADLIKKYNLEELSENLKNIHFYFSINTLVFLEEELSKLKNNLVNYKDKLPLPYKLIENDINNFLERFTKENFVELQKEVWQFCFENKIYYQGLLALREYIISKVASLYFEEKEIKEINNREKIESILRCRKFMRRIIGGELENFINIIFRTRNLVAHLKGHKRDEERTKKFIQNFNSDEVKNNIESLIGSIKSEIKKEDLDKIVEEINNNHNSKCKLEDKGNGINI